MSPQIMSGGDRWRCRLSCIPDGSERVIQAAARPEPYPAGELVGRLFRSRFGEQILNALAHPLIPRRPLPLEFPRPEMP